jgi:hypothetical protein
MPSDDKLCPTVRPEDTHQIIRATRRMTIFLITLTASTPTKLMSMRRFRGVQSLKRTNRLRL